MAFGPARFGHESLVWPWIFGTGCGWSLLASLFRGWIIALSETTCVTDLASTVSFGVPTTWLQQRVGRYRNVGSDVSPKEKGFLGFIDWCPRRIEDHYFKKPRSQSRGHAVDLRRPTRLGKKLPTLQAQSANSMADPITRSMQILQGWRSCSKSLIACPRILL